MNWAKTGKAAEKVCIGLALAFGLFTGAPEGLPRECCVYPPLPERRWIETDEDRAEREASDWLLGHGLLAVLTMGIMISVRNKWVQPEKKKG